MVEVVEVGVLEGTIFGPSFEDFFEISFFEAGSDFLPLLYSCH